MIGIAAFHVGLRNGPRVRYWLAVMCALMAGPAAVAGSAAASAETCAANGSVRDTTGDPPIAARLVTRPESSSKLRPAKRHRVFHAIARSDDPNDDETSNDPDGDDETWDNQDGNDETDVPIAAWLEDSVRWLTELEAEHAPAWRGTLASPFPTLERLRC